MRTHRILLAGALIAVPAAAFAGPRVGFGFNFGFPLYDYPAPRQVVVVQQPAATEAIPPSPGPDYVFIPGRWEWDTAGSRWIWYGGSWQKPPAPSAVWQAGYWSQANGGWTWVGAHWAVPKSPPAAAAGPAAPPSPPPAPQAAPEASAPTTAPAAGQPEVVVNEAPPAPLAEEVYAAPGPDYVWVGGVWTWNGAWVWAPGHYLLPPHPGAIWVGGGWQARGRGWAWVGGRWR